MPPKKSGSLTKAEIDMLKGWVEQGAVWPDDVKLVAKEKKSAATITPDTLELTKRIHAHIVATAKEKTEAEHAEVSRTRSPRPVPSTPWCPSKAVSSCSAARRPKPIAATTKARR